VVHQELKYDTEQNQYNYMKSIIYYALGFCMVIACSKNNSTDSKEMAEEENKDKLENTDIKRDAEFAVAAADGGMLEVKLGELAMKNANSAQVREFGQKMVDEHGKGNAQLKALAEQKGISIPTVLSDKNQKLVDELALKTGADFDKSYTDLMVKDHKEDIEEFKKEAEKGEDPELRAWASAILPTLEHHIQMAERAAGSLKE
jgi:putative membrane protein